jgi:hypothetical protein
VTCLVQMSRVEMPSNDVKKEKRLIAVKVRSFGAGELPDDLSAQLNSGQCLLVEVERGTTVEGLLRRIPPAGRGASFRDTIVVFVNDQQQELDCVLQPEDVIDLHILAAGG